jgi:hypothetical protein
MLHINNNTSVMYFIVGASVSELECMTHVGTHNASGTLCFRCFRLSVLLT